MTGVEELVDGRVEPRRRERFEAVAPTLLDIPRTDRGGSVDASGSICPHNKLATSHKTKTRDRDTTRVQGKDHRVI